MTRQELPSLDLDPELDPWDRQPGETSTRYAQFLIYRNLGRKRTKREVAETLTRNAGYVRQVAAAYLWTPRAEAYDRWREQRDEHLWLEERRKAHQDDATILDAAVRKLGQRLVALQPADLTPSDMVRLLDVTMRHRRALFGDPVATVAVTGPGGDPIAVQLADLAQMSPEQRHAAVVGLADDVRRRAAVAAGGIDDE